MKIFEDSRKVSRADLAAWLRQLAGQLESDGKVLFGAAGSVTVGDDVHCELEIEGSGSETSIEIEFTWTGVAAAEEAEESESDEDEAEEAEAEEAEVEEGKVEAEESDAAEEPSAPSTVVGVSSDAYTPSAPAAEASASDAEPARL